MNQKKMLLVVGVSEPVECTPVEIPSVQEVLERAYQAHLEQHPMRCSNELNGPLYGALLRNGDEGLRWAITLLEQIDMNRLSVHALSGLLMTILNEWPELTAEQMDGYIRRVESALRWQSVSEERIKRITERLTLNSEE